MSRRKVLRLYGVITREGIVPELIKNEQAILVWLGYGLVS
jgi:hypothetical protein